jgi:hypothetical protein
MFTEGTNSELLGLFFRCLFGYATNRNSKFTITLSNQHTTKSIRAYSVPAFAAFFSAFFDVGGVAVEVVDVDADLCIDIDKQQQHA